MSKPEKKKQILSKDEFIEKCGNSRVTLYCDRNDKLGDDQIIQFIKTGYIDIDPPELGNNESGVSDLFDELRREYYPLPLELSEDEIDTCKNSIGVDWDIPQLIRNTPDVYIHFQWVSNYDCVNSHYFECQSGFGYTYGENYMSQVLKLLRISPHTYRDIMRKDGLKTLGHYPAWKAKPLVDPKFFYDNEELERSAPASLFTIIGKLDLSAIEMGFPPTKFVIPKGNCVGFYSSDCGGISQLATPLLEDYVIDITKKSEHGDGWILTLDIKGSVHYTIDNIAGVTSEFWGKPVKIITEKRKKKTC